MKQIIFEFDTLHIVHLSPRAPLALGSARPPLGARQRRPASQYLDRGAYQRSHDRMNENRQCRCLGARDGGSLPLLGSLHESQRTPRPRKPSFGEIHGRCYVIHLEETTSSTLIDSYLCSGDSGCCVARTNQKHD